jgi:subtilisin family serine protease
LNWLDALDVRYVNMSFSGPRDPLVENAIARMHAKGVVFVAAAGNQGPTAPPSYPAAYPDVIAVTAVNRNGENYRHANRGDYVDVAAPGVEILAALPKATTGYRTGTSFAAPFVTSIVATRTDIETRSLTKAALLNRLSMRDLGPPGRDPIYGQGLALAPQSCSGRPGNLVQGPAQPTIKLPPQMSVGGPPAAPVAASGSW